MADKQISTAISAAFEGCFWGSKKSSPVKREAIVLVLEASLAISRIFLAVLIAAKPIEMDLVEKRLRSLWKKGVLALFSLRRESQNACVKSKTKWPPKSIS